MFMITQRGRVVLLNTFKISFYIKEKKAILYHVHLEYIDHPELLLYIFPHYLSHSVHVQFKIDSKVAVLTSAGVG